MKRQRRRMKKKKMMPWSQKRESLHAVAVRICLIFGGFPLEIKTPLQKKINL